MKLVALPKYVKHSAYRDFSPVDGGAVHAMRRGPEIVVDMNAFLYVEPKFSDAIYPDEPGGMRMDDMLVSAWFAKGGTWIGIETKASELARVLGRGSLPGEWIRR